MREFSEGEYRVHELDDVCTGIRRDDFDCVSCMGMVSEMHFRVSLAKTFSPDEGWNETGYRSISPRRREAVTGDH